MVGLCLVLKSLATFVPATSGLEGASALKFSVIFDSLMCCWWGVGEVGGLVCSSETSSISVSRG